MPRGCGLVPVRAGSTRRVTRTHGGNAAGRSTAPGMAVRRRGYACPGRLCSRVFVFCVVPGESGVDAGPYTSTGRSTPARVRTNGGPGTRKRGVHEHGSATRPRTGGFDAAAPAAGVGESRESGERNERHERDEFGERDGLGGAADGRRGNGRGLGPTAFWFCGGFGDGGGEGGYGGGCVRGHLGFCSWSSFGLGFCFGSGLGFFFWPGLRVRLGAGPGFRFGSGLGGGSGFRVGFRFEGCAGDAECVEQAWCVEYFECVGRVECAGDAGCVHERRGVGAAACLGRSREGATGGGRCAATGRRHGYGYGCGCVGVGQLGGFWGCGSFADRA